MKKLTLMFTIAIVAATLQTANAQVSLNINIGAQPNWGPRGYDYVEYYYMPEVNSYYHVPSKRYVYLNGNSWVHRKSLPKAYRHVNLYNTRKVVINQPQAYLRHDVYRTRYVSPRRDNGNHKGWYKEIGNKKHDRRHDNGRRGRH
jgi:hypothetical protein